jgi:thiol-disulfide isomerase/thioredoxin
MSGTEHTELQRYTKALLWLAGMSLFAVSVACAKEAKMVNERAASFAGAVEWLNSKPLTLAELHGKVVLVDFWTYTCVNWRRTLPYVRAWAQKYKQDGLVVIGVHTPEFSFERDLANVERATKEMDVAYPVAVDSNFAIWRAFGNEYWPALYLIDAKGNVRAEHFGEGDYQKTERTIQELLAEAGARDVDRNLVSVDPHGLEVAADWDNVRSTETYIGAERGERRVDAEPNRLRLNEWTLLGDWSLGKEAAVLNRADGLVAYRFHARDVNLVMGPVKLGSAPRFRVLVDEKPPGADRGGDVDANGYGTVSRQDTYQLIRQRKAIVDRLFEIQFLDPGVEAFDFTFG